MFDKFRESSKSVLVKTGGRRYVASRAKGRMQLRFMLKRDTHINKKRLQVVSGLLEPIDNSALQPVMAENHVIIAAHRTLIPRHTVHQF